MTIDGIEAEVWWPFNSRPCAVRGASESNESTEMIVWQRILHWGPGSKTTTLPRLRQKKIKVIIISVSPPSFLPLTSGRLIQRGGRAVGEQEQCRCEPLWRKGEWGRGSGLRIPRMGTPRPTSPSPAFIVPWTNSWDSGRTKGTQDCLMSFLQRAGRKRKEAEVWSSPWSNWS